MSRLDHQAQIRGQGAIVGRSGRLVVLVGGHDVIGELAGTLLDLAFVVGFGVVFVFFGHGFHFVDGVGDADEGAPGDAAEGVAGGADFAVNLEAAAEAVGVIRMMVEGGGCVGAEWGVGYAWWSNVLVHFSCSHGYFVACRLCLCVRSPGSFVDGSVLTLPRPAS